MTDYISHMPEIAISDLKKKLVSQDTKPSIIVGFTLPKLDFVAANLESLRQGLKKCMFGEIFTLYKTLT